MSPSPLSFPASQNTPYTAHPDFSLYHHALEYVRLNPFFFSTTGRILVSFPGLLPIPGLPGQHRGLRITVHGVRVLGQDAVHQPPAGGLRCTPDCRPAPSSPSVASAAASRTARCRRCAAPAAASRRDTVSGSLPPGAPPPVPIFGLWGSCFCSIDRPPFSSFCIPPLFPEKYTPCCRIQGNRARFSKIFLF